MNTLGFEQEYYENLIIQYLSGSISSEDLVRLNAWIDFKPENKLFFIQTRELWLASKVVSNPKGFSSNKGYQQFLAQIKQRDSEKRSSSRREFIFTWQKIAAVLFLTFGLGIVAHYVSGKLFASKEMVAQQEIIVPLGSKSKIKLPDGTIVTLNAGSRLTYQTNFGKSNREVRLEGEGYFAVAKDPKRTFIVKTNYLDIKALGTEFNVKAYPGEKTIQTTLVEGSVQIEKTFRNAAEKSAESAVILKPKEKYTFLIDSDNDYQAKKDNVPTSPAVEDYSAKDIAPRTGVVLKNIDPVPDISWKEKRWIISGEELGVLAVKLERRYDVSINFDNEALKTFRFSGTLQDESVEQVLKVISLSSPIVFEIHGKEVTFNMNNEFAQKYKGLYRSK